MEILIINNMHLDLIGTLLILSYLGAVFYFELTEPRVNLYTLDDKLDLILKKL